MGTALFTDGDEANADRFNQTIAAGGGVKGTFEWFGRVKYNGSSWEVDASHASAKITTGALAWDGTDNELEITLTDFASIPLVHATPVAADTNYNCKGHGVSTTKAVVRFYAISGGAKITTESTLMDVNVTIKGNYLT